MAVLILVTQEALDETAAPYQRLVTTFKQDLRKVANNSWLVKTAYRRKISAKQFSPEALTGRQKPVTLCLLSELGGDFTT